MYIYYQYHKLDICSIYGNLITKRDVNLLMIIVIIIHILLFLNQISIY